MTRDIDIVIVLEAKDVNRVVDAFETRFYIERATVVEAVNHVSMFNVIHNEFHVKVDLIIRKNEPFRKEEFSRRREFSLQGKKTWVVSPEDLVLSKLYWAKDSLSEMQLNDVRDLVSSVKNLDLGYIDSWVKQLDVQHLWQKVKK